MKGGKRTSHRLSGLGRGRATVEILAASYRLSALHPMVVVLGAKEVLVAEVGLLQVAEDGALEMTTIRPQLPLRSLLDP